MSALTSLGKLLAAIAAAGLAIALCLAPIAGLGGVAVARTDETMRSNLSDIADGHMPGVTTITDVEGTPLAWVFSQRRYEVPSEQISPYVKDALISTEDRRFYEHDGVDIQGFARAMVTNVLAGGVEQGASTINQQYVKNYLWLVDAETTEEAQAATEQSIPRKLREMRMAAELDKTLGKDEILTNYLNLVSFGNHAFGIEAAARTYFDMPAKDLGPKESALLVGLLQSVEYLNPYTNPEGATERRNVVLHNMANAGSITQAEADELSAQPLGTLAEPNFLPDGCLAAGDAGFLCDYALTYLAGKGLPQEELEKGSYTITTTLDPQVQRAAENAIRSSVDPSTAGVAGVLDVIRPGEESHDIAAMATSRYFGLDLAQNQTIMPQASSLVGNGAGSVFKIFAAAVALEQGMGLDTMLDTPERSVVYGMGEGGAKNCPPGAYCVENAGRYQPQLSLRDALAQSPNTTFIELVQKLGVEPTVDMAVRLGLRSYADEGTFDGKRSIKQAAVEGNMGSFVLGPLAVNPLELSNVGATLASGGRWCEPNPIAKVTDKDGNEVFINRPPCEQVVDKELASSLAQGMSEDAKTGTARGAAAAAGWNAPVAAKTGTTESHQSSAFFGFNRALSGAPYIFNDGTQTTPLCTAPVRQCAEGTLFGGNEAAEAWFRMAGAVPGAREAGLPESSAVFDRGKRQAALDTVIGMSTDQARSQLEGQGLRVVLQTVFGDGAPRGTVISATPTDPNLPPGTLVRLSVSDGSPSRPSAPKPSQQTDFEQLQRQLDDARSQLEDIFGRNR
ncbi:transglycosylase domain-containing protein [Corynebacterium liangguodongii]|uniref:Penicillin-binding protein n=1 Tax=Corynebacterium liangguodongii TaxID=2079535 RepID=A0A2S0WBS1_9CORY|nr:transglycosylase domain-containing protein [Corynebacterium liangguodongii]AWB83216.1 penicillin-binding protein [Corynebacterium liangguodongii]PWB98687.1 PASTA domain-containing protein [Corynebacterium liangguodongii]